MISRAVVLLAYFLLCLRTMPELSRGFRFNAVRMKPLVGFGGWLTLSSFMVPSISFIDRFMIGALISLSAVTVYITPYEVITKLTIFWPACSPFCFPLSARWLWSVPQRSAGYTNGLLNSLLVLVAPIVGVLLALSEDLLSLWIGAEIARSSAPVGKWLAVGVLIYVLAQVPFTALQGIGRADVTAKLQLIQLPFYALAVWYLIGALGVTGVAVAWTLRALCEAVIFFVAAGKLLPAPGEENGRNFFRSPASPHSSCFSWASGWRCMTC